MYVQGHRLLEALLHALTCLHEVLTTMRRWSVSLEQHGCISDGVVQTMCQKGEACRHDGGRDVLTCTLLFRLIELYSSLRHLP